MMAYEGQANALLTLVQQRADQNVTVAEVISNFDRRNVLAVVQLKYDLVIDSQLSFLIQT